MRLALAFAILTILLVLPWSDLSAAGLGGRKFELDFTKGDAIASRVAWSPAEHLGITGEGLGWDGGPASSWDSWVETTEPLAVGESYRAPRSVSLGVHVHREFEWESREDLTIRVHGVVFARYSPDATNWSSWQKLSRDEKRDTAASRAYRGTISVPRRQHEIFDDLVREYAKLNVPWKMDEEAAVRWIIEKDPTFLERTMPFVGYLQIHYETSLYGGHRLKRLVIQAGWATPGHWRPPSRAGADQGRQNTPWRFRSMDDPKVEEPDWTHVLPDGTLHVAAEATDTELDLRKTGISDEGLTPIRRLTGLRSLNLFGTGIGDPGLEPVGELVNLNRLDLSRTAISDAGLLHLEGLTALQSLGLRQTRVSDEGIEVLSGMPGMENLDLLGTKVTDDGLETIGRLAALRTLSLWSTGVTDEGLAHLGDLVELRKLSLGGGRSTRITNAGVAHLAKLPHLEELGLTGTGITDGALKLIGGMKSLRTLHVSDTEITDAGLAHLAGLTGLEMLGLRGTAVTDAGLVHLQGLAKLRSLRLNDTEVTDAGLAHLVALESLEELAISDTAVTREALKELERKLPKLRNIW